MVKYLMKEVRAVQESSPRRSTPPQAALTGRRHKTDRNREGNLGPDFNTHGRVEGVTCDSHNRQQHNRRQKQAKDDTYLSLKQLRNGEVEIHPPVP